MDLEGDPVGRYCSVGTSEYYARHSKPQGHGVHNYSIFTPGGVGQAVKSIVERQGSGTGMAFRVLPGGDAACVVRSSQVQSFDANPEFELAAGRL